MQVTKIAGHVNHARTQSFQGYWKDSTMDAPYPYEDTDISVKTYVADVDESFDEIARNFQAKAYGQGPTRDIFQASNRSPYTIGGVNYFTDLSQNREAQKRSYTMSAERNIKDKRWVEAVEDKLKIAKILREQGPRMEKDKFLTEEGIRTIFHAADTDSKMTIAALVSGYNKDMAKGLIKTLIKMK